MEIEYIGKLLPDGHISVDPSVLPKIKKGEKLRIKIEPIDREKMNNRMRQKRLIRLRTESFPALQMPPGWAG